MNRRVAMSAEILIAASLRSSRLCGLFDRSIQLRQVLPSTEGIYQVHVYLLPVLTL